MQLNQGSCTQNINKAKTVLPAGGHHLDKVLSKYNNDKYEF